MRGISNVGAVVVSVVFGLTSATAHGGKPVPPKAPAAESPPLADEGLVVHVVLKTAGGSKDELLEIELKALELRQLLVAKPPHDQPFRTTACDITWCEMTYVVADADAALRKLLTNLNAWSRMQGGYVEKSYRDGRKERVPFR
jgi:hypothetical protein